MNGWEKVGMALTPGGRDYLKQEYNTQSNRQQVQQDDMALRGAQSGLELNNKTGKWEPIKGSALDYQTQTIKALMEQQELFKIQNASTSTRQAIVSGFENGDYSTLSSLIKEDPTLNKLFTGQNIQAFEALDINNKNHQEALRAVGIDDKFIKAYQKIIETKSNYKKSKRAISDYDSEIESRVDAMRDEVEIGEDGIARAVYTEAEINDFITESTKYKEDMIASKAELRMSRKDKDLLQAVDQLRMAYPIVRGIDNSYSVADMQSMAGMMNLLRGSYDAKFEKALKDNYAQSQLAMKGITDAANKADINQKNADATLRQSQASLNYQQHAMQKPLVDDMTNADKEYRAGKITLDERNQRFADIYETMRAGQGKETAAERNQKADIAYQDYISKMTGGKGLQDFDLAKWLEKEKDTTTQEGREAAQFMNTLRAKAAKNKPKDSDLKQIHSLASGYDRLSKAGDIRSVVGIVDANIKELTSSLGISLKSGEATKQLLYNTVRSIATKDMGKGNMSKLDYADREKQFASLHKDDQTVIESLKVNLDNSIAKYEGLKNSNPEYYALYLKKDIDMMKALSNDLGRFSNARKQPLYTTPNFGQQPLINATQSANELKTIRNKKTGELFILNPADGSISPKGGN